MTAVTERETKKIQISKAELECPLCLTTFVDPRVLDCQHCFCFKCLYRYHHSSTQILSPQAVCGTIACPLKCRKLTFIGSIFNLPQNFIVSQLSFTARKNEYDERYANQRESSSVGCEWCSRLNSVDACSKCYSFVCKSCQKGASLHSTVCSSTGHYSDAGNKISLKAESSSQNSNLSRRYPPFFSEDDAIRSLLIICRKEKSAEPDVLSCNLQYLPMAEYEVVQILRNSCAIRFNAYFDPLCDKAVSLSSSFIDSECSVGKLFRLNYYLSDALRRCRQQLMLFIQETVKAIKRLQPVAPRVNGEINEILLAPSGYQLMCAHLVWMGEQLLFIIRHLVSPLLARLYFSQLMWVIQKEKKNFFSCSDAFPWNPHHNFRSEPGSPWNVRSDSRAAELQECVRTSFHDINFSRSQPSQATASQSSPLDNSVHFSVNMPFSPIWSRQWNLLLSQIGELEETVEGVQQAIDEVQQIFEEYHYLLESSPLQWKVKSSSISLRYYFLNNDDHNLEEFSQKTMALLSDLYVIQNSSSYFFASAVSSFSQSAEQEAIQVIVENHRKASLSGLLYLVWHNHRLHHVILSGLMGLSSYNRGILSAVLKTCYRASSNSFTVLNPNVLIFSLDLSDQTVPSLPLVLQSFMSDLKNQITSRNEGILAGCRASSNLFSVLDALSLHHHVEEPFFKTDLQLSRLPVECVKIMRKLSCLPYAELEYLEGTKALPFVSGLVNFLTRFARVDACFRLLVNSYDQHESPEIHDTNSSLEAMPDYTEVSLPFFNVKSEVNKLWNTSTEGTVLESETISDDYRLVSGRNTLDHMLELIESREAFGQCLENTGDERLANLWNTLASGLLSIPSLDSLEIAPANPVEVPQFQTKNVKFVRNVEVPTYLVSCRINGELYHISFNAHTGEIVTQKSALPLLKWSAKRRSFNLGKMFGVVKAFKLWQ